MNENQELDEILENNTITCIGVDKKIHRCIAWDVKCLCGIKISIKNPPDSLLVGKFSCYHCTY